MALDRIWPQTTFIGCDTGRLGTENGSLSAREIEIIKLAVSEVSGRDYFLAAHTLMGKKAGLNREAILALRRGQPSGDTRNDALATFARTLVSTSVG